MAIFTDGVRLESETRNVTDYEASFGETLGATASQTLADSPVSQLAFLAELERARGFDYSRMPAIDDTGGFGTEPMAASEPPPASIDKLEAASRIKAAGLEKDVSLDRESFTAPELDLIINHAKARKEREVTIARGPQGFFAGGAQLATSFLVGAIDPINVASAFIPVVGELRYGKLLASAGESALRRSAVRAGVGATEGMVGQALLEPLNWYAHTQEGRDFGAADVLKDLIFGAALGGALHPAGGAVADVYRSRQGRPLYPFGPGELLENIRGTHVPAKALEDGIDAADLSDGAKSLLGSIDQLLASPNVPPVVRMLEDLPPRAKEDSMRAAIAAVIDGEPVKVGEMLEAAAAHEPRIAESFEAFHGSPHDFDRFDISKIGTGEGAQMFGHGLYFAEREDVARRYKQTVSDKAFVDKVAGLYDEGFSPGDAWAEVKDSWSDFSAGEQRLMLALEKDDWLGFDYPHQAVSAALRSLKSYDASAETVEAVRAIGQMYRVRISADREHFLDWDKPLGQQAAYVRERFLAALPDTPNVQAWKSNGTLEHADLGTVVKGLGLNEGAQSIAQRLREAGIPGIRYLDQGSRKAGEGTSNFVLFDDKHIEIVSKNGEPVKQAELPPRLHALSAEARNWPELPQGARIVGQGEHGPELDGLQGRWSEAVAWLSQAQSGDARGVLEHPSVGRIDVVWGTKAYGLEHIIELHPEVVGDMPERLARMKLLDVVQAGKPGERVVLQSPDGAETALIRTSFDGEKKIWLLTAYTPESDRRGRGGGTTESPSGNGPTRSSAPPEGSVGGLPEAGNTKIVLGAGKPRSRGRAAADPETFSLVEHLASKGGLRADPELEAIYGGARGPFVSGFGPLIRKDGMSLDDALTSAKEHGYFFDPHDAANGTAGVTGRTSMGLTPRDLLDAIDAENRGNRLYKAAHLEATKFDPDQEAHVILQHIEGEFEAAGLRIDDIDPALLKRTTEIVRREGEQDVMAAYERAIIEDADRYEAIANAKDAAEQQQVPFDAGGAPGARGPDPVDGGRAGRARPGRSGATSQQSSLDGRGDIRPPEDAWRELAARSTDVEDAQQLAASREAEQLPEPVVTRLDERVAAAEKAEGFAREMYAMFADRLPEGERRRLDDFIKTMDDEHAVRTQAIERSGACLFGARS